MSLSEKPDIESAVEAEVNDPLTSTVLDDMDSTDNLGDGSSTNLLHDNHQDEIDHAAAQDNTAQSTLNTTSDLLIEEVSPYDNQHWDNEDVELEDADDMPDINLEGTTTYESKPEPEPQPKIIIDPTHAEGFVNAKDHPDAVELPVQGELPGWLKGEHFTIGPGTYDIKFTRKIEVDGQLESATSTFTFGHWFDSLPLVNRFDFDGASNTITYRSRLTSKRLIEKIRDRHGYAPPHPAGLFKTDSNQTILVKFLKSATKASKPDCEPCAASISTYIPGVEGKLFAQNHANHLQELDPFDLKPTRIMCWNEINPAFKGYSASPNAQYDAVTGEWINYTMEVGYQSTKYHFFSLSDRDPKGTIIASVVADTSYVHSFALTPHYIILAVFPFTAQMAGVKYAWNESILDSFTFNDSNPTLFYVVSREGQQHIATYRADACFAFHHVNAFEDANGGINIDIVTYPDDTIAHQLATNNLRNPKLMNPAHLAKHEIRRFYLADVQEESINFFSNNALSTSSITGRASSVWSYVRNAVGRPKEADIESDHQTASWAAAIPRAREEVLLTQPLELPQVNRSVKQHAYNFVWGLSVGTTGDANTEGKMWNCIVKANLNNKEVNASWSQPHCYPSEAYFIPRPSRGPDDLIDEDDGVLVSVVLDAQRASSFLLVLDANTMQSICRADLPQMVPMSFARSYSQLAVLDMSAGQENIDSKSENVNSKPEHYKPAILNQMADQGNVTTAPEPIFVDIGDSSKPSEIESLCMQCHETGITRLLLTKIPHFKEVIVMAFECEHCGFRNNELQSAGAISEKGHTVTCKIDNKEDLNRQLVKSDYASVKFIELDLEIPSTSKRGVLTTVEGILSNAIEDLAESQPVRKHVDENLYNQIQAIIEKLESYKDDNAPFTIRIDDPSGNSYIENLCLPAQDPKLEVRWYQRTPEQEVQLGLRSADEPETTTENAEDDEVAPEIMTFPSNCSHCNAPSETNMHVLDIPHFKEVIIMATNCQHCGYKSNEVKAGGAIAPLGKRITLRMTESDDLSRDILKSETCGLGIPEINFELTPGTLGGRFTTVEGLLRQVHEELDQRAPFLQGDSASEESRLRWKAFLDKLQQVADGELFPCTLVLNDPLANSYLQNLYAPDDDPEMTTETYERDFETNEGLGLNDMKLENYEQDGATQDHPMGEAQDGTSN